MVGHAVRGVLKTPLLGSSAGDCPQTFGQLLEQVAGRKRGWADAG